MRESAIEERTNPFLVYQAATLTPGGTAHLGIPNMPLAPAPGRRQGPPRGKALARCGCWLGGGARRARLPCITQRMGREAMTVGGDSAQSAELRSLARQSESENEECEQESFRSDTAQATAEYDL